MKLKLAEFHCYNERALKELKPFLDNEITLEGLINLPVEAAVCRASSKEQSALVIYHPSAY